MTRKSYIRILFFGILFVCLSGQSHAQQVRVRGTVTDAATGEPLPFTNVVLMPANLGVGVMTDNDGRYALTFTVKGEGVLFSFIGYEPATIPLSEVKNGVLDMKLTPLSSQLEEVVIAGSRTRYRNRDNPAVELIRKAIANKDKNRIEAHNTYEYERYEKIQLSINEMNDSVQNGVLFR
jgi:hypothetical protein